jgi:hypothetical protein
MQVIIVATKDSKNVSLEVVVQSPVQDGITKCFICVLPYIEAIKNRHICSLELLYIFDRL